MGESRFKMPLVQPTLLALNAFQKDILHVILYSDLFYYPLTQDEIGERLNRQLETGILDQELSFLVDHGCLHQLGPYYSTINDPDLRIRRQNGNRLARHYLNKSIRFLKIMSGFPFVKAIFISGSISKNFAEKKGDVDFFIICKDGRVWLLKTMLILFKKIFLFNNHKFFCANYILSENHLEIQVKNIYTAYEVRTLLPVYGSRICREFIEANNWTNQYLPYLDYKFHLMHQPGKQWIKPILEWLFSWKIIDSVDTLMMKLIRKNWIRRYRANYGSSEAFEKMLSTSKHASRAHHRNFHLVPELLKASIKKYEQEKQLNIT